MTKPFGVFCATPSAKNQLPFGAPLCERSIELAVAAATATAAATTAAALRIRRDALSGDER